MHMYYLIRLCEIALQVKNSGQSLVEPVGELWELAVSQYDAYPPGKFEWPALLRLCESLDPAYKN